MGKIASSISIIGGADGPTSVFIAGKVGSLFWLGLIGAGIVIVGGILFLIFKNHK